MMMLFFTVAMVHIVALMSPGPDFFFVSQTAVSRSRKRSDDGRTGHYLRRDGMGGRGAAWPASHHRKNGLAAYDHYGRRRPVPVLDGLSDAARRAEKNRMRRRLSPHIELAQSGRSFLKGLLTNLSNPKAIIYFGSVFSLFVGDNVGAAARWGIFALITLETLAWFTVVASLFRAAENAPRLSASGEMD
ncbi:threonine efflux system [Salmonella enterica subsp. enterica]|uniref:Threonine efflux system n=1 Tax=Salmonella enterica I TaxID=59201 RepID=A0A379W138_SALET|nr:threonine efflux system [Salmonella enterica subsp. enterica]